MTLDFEDILAAQARLEGHIERTPCRHSRTLSEITGAEVWVKFENHQFTAAYKERGALNKLLLLGENVRSRGVIAASAGNHSQGLSYHAARLGIPVTIVMPKGTPFVKVQQTRAHGAEVLIEGDSYAEASAPARQDCDDRLIAGMATAAKHIKRDIRIVGLEPAMFPSFTARMRGVRTAQVNGASTIAEGIAVKEVGEHTYAIARPLIDEVLLIEEPHFERGIALYCNVEKTVTEGAGAASLAGLLAYPERFRGKKCGLVITGGNIDTRLLASVLTRELVRESRIVSLRIIGDDRPGLLANVSLIIGQMGANIIEVAHNRLALDVPAKGAEFDVMIETRDAQHTNEVMDALRERGYPPRVV